MGAETRTRIAIPGGSGQMGTALARYFHARGHEVTVLSRSPQAAPWRTLAWDGRTLGAWVEALDGCDAWINLSGRSVNCRYNQRNRAEILDSRVEPTLALHRALRTVTRPPRVWLNAATATIYRHAFDRPMDEATGELGGAEPGAPDTWRFSIEVAKAWESAFFSEQPTHTRMVALRSAMTFTPDRGGVFDVLSGLVRLGLGGSQGDGTSGSRGFTRGTFCARSNGFWPMNDWTA